MNFHFLRQNNDGTWSHKRGSRTSEYIINMYNPNIYNWNYMYYVGINETECEDGYVSIDNFYDSSICYIAITVDTN